MLRGQCNSQNRCNSNQILLNTEIQLLIVDALWSLLYAIALFRGWFTYAFQTWLGTQIDHV